MEVDALFAASHVKDFTRVPRTIRRKLVDSLGPKVGKPALHCRTAFPLDALGEHPCSCRNDGSCQKEERGVRVREHQSLLSGRGIDSENLGLEGWRFGHRDAVVPAVCPYRIHHGFLGWCRRGEKCSQASQRQNSRSCHTSAHHPSLWNLTGKLARSMTRSL